MFPQVYMTLTDDINGNWLSCLGHFALKDLLFGLPIV